MKVKEILQKVRDIPGFKAACDAGPPTVDEFETWIIETMLTGSQVDQRCALGILCICQQLDECETLLFDITHICAQFQLRRLLEKAENLPKDPPKKDDKQQGGSGWIS